MDFLLLTNSCLLLMLYIGGLLSSTIYLPGIANYLLVLAERRTLYETPCILIIKTMALD